MGFNQLQLFFLKLKLYHFWKVEISSHWLLSPYDMTTVVINFLHFHVIRCSRSHTKIRISHLTKNLINFGGNNISRP